MSEIADSSPLAAQFKRLSSLKGIQDAGGLAVELAHGKRFHVTQYTSDREGTQAILPDHSEE